MLLLILLMVVMCDISNLCAAFMTGKTQVSAKSLIKSCCPDFVIAESYLLNDEVTHGLC